VIVSAPPVVFAVPSACSPRADAIASTHLGFAAPCPFPTSPPQSTPTRSTSRSRFGRSVPTGRSRSTLVVSHHLGGFLLREVCGFVAPRYQIGLRWVSGACRLQEFALRRAPRGRYGPLPLHRELHTPRRTSPARSRVASPRRLAILPFLPSVALPWPAGRFRSVRFRAARGWAATSWLCSPGRVGSFGGRFRLRDLTVLPGLCSPSRSETPRPGLRFQSAPPEGGATGCGPTCLRGATPAAVSLLALLNAPRRDGLTRSLCEMFVGLLPHFLTEAKFFPDRSRRSGRPTFLGFLRRLKDRSEERLFGRSPVARMTRGHSANRVPSLGIRSNVDFARWRWAIVNLCHEHERA
jgi:hypothetical protein